MFRVADLLLPLSIRSILVVVPPVSHRDILRVGQSANARSGGNACALIGCGYGVWGWGERRGEGKGPATRPWPFIAQRRTPRPRPKVGSLSPRRGSILLVRRPL